MTMRSEVLTAYVDPETKQMNQIIAEGKVNATQGDRMATGEKAVFDDKSKTVTLTGNPIMRQGNNQVTGVKVIYFTEQDRSVVEGDKNTRVTATMFPDELKGRERGDAKTK
jgi:lipopolysaccharide export system protein LptA